MIDNLAAWGLFVGVGMTATGLGIRNRTEGALGVNGVYSIVYNSITISIGIFLCLISGFAVVISGYLVDVTHIVGFPTVYIESAKIILSLSLSAIAWLIAVAFFSLFFVGIPSAIHEFLGILAMIVLGLGLLMMAFGYLTNATSEIRPLIAMLVIIVPLITAISIEVFRFFAGSNIIEYGDSMLGNSYPTVGFISMFIFGWGFVLHGAATTPVTHFGEVFVIGEAILGGALVGVTLSINGNIIGTRFDKRKYQRERKEAQEEIEQLTQEIENKLKQAEQKRDSELYSSAVSALNSAERHYEDVSGKAKKYDLSFDLTVDKIEIDQRIKQARQLEAKADAESANERFEDLMQDAERMYNFDNMDAGDTKIEQAREEKEKLESLASDYQIDSINLTNAKFEIDRRRRSLIETQYQSLLDDGDDYESAAKQATKDGQYITAVNHCEAGIEVAERAVSLSKEYIFLDTQSAQGSAQQFLELKCDVLSDAVANTQTNLQSNPSATTIKKTINDLENYIQILNGIDANDQTIQDSFQIIEDVTENQLVLGKLLDSKKTIEKAIESFNDGNYGRAKQRFKTVQSDLSKLEKLSDRYDVDTFDADIKQLKEDSETNEERAHKMELGLESKLQLIEPNLKTDQVDDDGTSDTQVFHQGNGGGTSDTEVFTGGGTSDTEVFTGGGTSDTEVFTSETNQDWDETEIFNPGSNSSENDTESDELNCPQCGKRIRDIENTKFCSKCGEEL